MKVVLTGTFNERDTGPSRVTEGLAGGLADHGEDVLILGHGDRKSHPHESVDVRHLGETPTSVLGFFQLYRRIRTALSEEDFDIFHPLEEYPGGSQIRTVQWTVDDYERLNHCPEDFRGYGFLAGEIILNIANVLGCLQTSTVVASSPETERQMSEYWRYKPDTVISLGIDEGELTPPEEHDGIRVLLPGRITPKKGQKSVLDHLNPNSEDYDVDIVGGVADESYYAEISQWHEHHHGFVERSVLNDLYRAADIVVVPSAHENYSLTALEGISHGCVVIVTERCGFAQFEWANPENGIYPVSNGQSAAETVIALTKDEVVESSQRAYEFAQNLTWDKVAVQYIELYQESIDSSSKD